MSKMLSKMNLISIVQQLPSEDIETMQGYVEMIENENEKLKGQVKHLDIVNRRLRKNIGKIESENQQLLKENEKQKEIIEKIQREVDKIFKEYQPFNRAVLLTMLENINDYIKEV